MSFVRFDAGTATTLYDWGVELAEGELLPANIGNVSVWMNGNEIPVYVEALGAWPDGSARTLYVQASQTGTQDTPISGEIRLTGGFTQPRRAFVDQSARWDNKAWTIAADYTANATSVTVQNNTGASVTLNSGALVTKAIADGGAPSRTITNAPMTIANGATAVLSLSGGFDVSYATGASIYVQTDDNGPTTAYTTRSGGLPAGVIVSTNPIRLCAATGTGTLTPLSSQQQFSVASYTSESVDTALEASYEVPGLSTLGNPAMYERGLMIWHRYCRTGNLSYLKDFCAYTAQKRENGYPAVWKSSASLTVEQEYEMLTRALMFLFRRDTVQRDSIIWHANRYTDVQTALRPTANWSIMADVACLWMGQTTALAGGTAYPTFVANTRVPKYLADGANVVTQRFNANLPVSRAWDQFGATIGFVYPFTSGLYLHALIRLYHAISDSTARTNIAAKINASIDAMLASGLLTTTDSIAALPSWYYSNVNVFTEPRSFTVATNYTAGSLTIELTNASGANRTINIVRDGTRGRVATGGESRGIVSPGSIANGATATVTLQSGFSSNLTAGTSVTLLQEQQAEAIPTGGGTSDLNGFWPAVFAWDWWINGDTTSRDHARAFYVSLGATPRDGNAGPFLSNGSKWVTEAFHSSQETPAMLAKRT